MHSIQTPKEFIIEFNKRYEQKHRAYENNFWATKMNLKDNSVQDLTRTKGELDEFLGDELALKKVENFLQQELDQESRKVLECFRRVLGCYIIKDPKAVEIKRKIDVLEAELEKERNNMKLGYTVDGVFTPASSVQLRNLMTTNPDEKIRKAAYDGLRSIGPFVVEKFCEIIKLRNQFAKSLGYKNYYDMKVIQAEGFNQDTLFQILDDLKSKSQSLNLKCREKLAEKNPSNLDPWNLGHVLSGDNKTLTDPYFPFENAVDSWARSFAALGIDYQQATMQLDLVDRQGKYSNGFCHWPQVAWISENGWVPSQTNFTSLATPKAVGSGQTALITLMHEGGHAAHFANVKQPSPLFGQERAPTSVAYAENQSMFLDSLVRDSDWLAKYALSRDGQPIPWELIEKKIKSEHPATEVFGLCAMIAVPFFERAIYDLSPEKVNPEYILELADQIEVEIQGGLATRPLLSVPHILSDESSAYYHGYVLAEMSVYQTRKHFLEKYGYIVDNPKVGHDLTEYYWKSGNSEMFLDLVKNLTGKPLSCDAWIEHLNMPLDEYLQKEKLSYEKALKEGPKYKPGTNVNLNMTVKFVHGDLLVSSTENKSLYDACQDYKKWVAEQ